MALQTIGIGSVADDGTGDTLRTAGDKINDNFNEIYTTLGDGSTLNTGVTALNNATANELVTVGATTTELDAEANLTFDGSTLTVTGNITVPNDGDIGSVGATDAIQISSAGIITFKDDIIIKDAGTIGSASDTDAITIAASGAVTFSQRDVHSSGITVADGGEIGSASDTDAIAISAAGVITLSSTTDSTSASTGSLVTHSIGVADDASFGDQVTLFVASGKVKRDGTAAFLVLNGTDSDSANAGDNIIDETDSDDIILEDQIFHHTGHASVSLTIFDSGGAIVKSLIGVHQDTSEIN